MIHDGASWKLVLRYKSHTEAESAETILRGVAVPKRYPTIPSIAAPATATQNPRKTTTRPCRITTSTTAIVAITVPVATPLPYIASHIINTQFIRLQAPYLMRLTTS